MQMFQEKKEGRFLGN